MTQAILMSLCLQSMVEELLRIRSGAKIKMVRKSFINQPIDIRQIVRHIKMDKVVSSANELFHF